MREPKRRYAKLREKTYTQTQAVKHWITHQKSGSVSEISKMVEKESKTKPGKNIISFHSIDTNQCSIIAHFMRGRKWFAIHSQVRLVYVCCQKLAHVNTEYACFPSEYYFNFCNWLLNSVLVGSECFGKFRSIKIVWRRKPWIKSTRMKSEQKFRSTDVNWNGCFVIAQTLHFISFHFIGISSFQWYYLTQIWSTKKSTEKERKKNNYCVRLVWIFTHRPKCVTVTWSLNWSELIVLLVRTFHTLTHERATV